MDPEKVHKLRLRYVLNKLKLKYLTLSEGDVLEYYVEYNDGVEVDGCNESMHSGEEIDILNKLESLGVIEILNPGGIDEYR